MFELLKFLADLVKDIVPKAARMKAASQRRLVAAELLELYKILNDCLLVGNDIVRNLSRVLTQGHDSGVHLHELSQQQLRLLSMLLRKVYALRYALGLLDAESAPRLARLVDSKMTALDWLSSAVVKHRNIYPGWTVDQTGIGTTPGQGLRQDFGGIDFLPIPVEGRMSVEEATNLGLEGYLQDARERLSELQSITIDFRSALVQAFSVDDLLVLVGTRTPLGDSVPFLDAETIARISGDERTSRWYPHLPPGFTGERGPGNGGC